jgi:hypothetical protein
MQNITYLSKNEDLEQEVWTFWLRDFVLYVDSYRVNRRPTKRHGWKNEQYYTRLDQRQNTMSAAEVAVLFTPEIAEAAKKWLMEMISVKMWDR